MNPCWCECPTPSPASSWALTALVTPDSQLHTLLTLQGEPPGHEQDAGQGGLHHDEESHLCHAGMVGTPQSRAGNALQPQRQLALLALTPEMAGRSLYWQPFPGNQFSSPPKV